MKASFLLAAALLIGLPLAAAAATPQQQRMADCSAKNKGLKGDAYKTAQSACLSGHATDTKAATPQERMKQCNADLRTCLDRAAEYRVEPAATARPPVRAASR